MLFACNYNGGLLCSWWILMVDSYIVGEFKWWIYCSGVNCCSYWIIGLLTWYGIESLLRYTLSFVKIEKCCHCSSNVFAKRKKLLKLLVNYITVVNNSVSMSLGSTCGPRNDPGNGPPMGPHVVPTSGPHINPNRWAPPLGSIFCPQQVGPTIILESFS